MSDTKTDERQLIARACEGDTDAFNKLVVRYYRRALRVALGYVHTRHDAEDVVQEAFVKAYRYLHKFRADCSFYTWLYRIVANVSLDRVRRRRRDRNVYFEDESSREAVTRDRVLWPTFEHMNPYHQAQRGQLQRRIRAALTQLPAIHQSVLVLREVRGLSYEEIAETLGIKKGTVMSRLFHARKAIQDRLLEAEADELCLLEHGGPVTCDNYAQVLAVG